MSMDTTDKGPVTGIDHARIGVRDLEAARESFNRLGFTTSPRGRHVGWGTANYTIVFEHDYLELLGVVDPSQFVGGLDKFLEYGEGLFRVSFATPDSQRLHTWLTESGFQAEPPKDLGRLIDFEEGEEVLRFKLVALPHELTPGLEIVNVCQHLTPEMLRRPEWLSHPNGARAISELTVVMEDVVGVGESYGRLFGADAISRDERKGTVTVRAGSSNLLFATPDTFTQRHYEVELDPDMPLPRVAALTLAVADPKATALYLSGQQVEYEREPDGTVLVPDRLACGTLLEFNRAE